MKRKNKRDYPNQPISHLIWNENNPKDKISRNDGYVIHHIDGNHSNDSPENHQKMLWKDHSSLHNKGKKLSQKTKEKLSRAHTGKILSKEHKEKIRKGGMGNTNGNTSFLGKKHTEETKRKMSEARKKKWKEGVYDNVDFWENRKR
ncbi:MAG: NUMOD3 domain-containing DNA-binding protein [Candidatus Hodarchaeales archaeon]|jgi:hypothetical protein